MNRVLTVGNGMGIFWLTRQRAWGGPGTSELVGCDGGRDLPIPAVYKVVNNVGIPVGFKVGDQGANLCDLGGSAYLVQYLCDPALCAFPGLLGCCPEVVIIVQLRPASLQDRCGPGPLRRQGRLDRLPEPHGLCLDPRHRFAPVAGGVLKQ